MIYPPIHAITSLPSTPGVMSDMGYTGAGRITDLILDSYRYYIIAFWQFEKFYGIADDNVSTVIFLDNLFHDRLVDTTETDIFARLDEDVHYIDMYLMPNDNDMRYYKWTSDVANRLKMGWQLSSDEDTVQVYWGNDPTVPTTGSPNKELSVIGPTIDDDTGSVSGGKLYVGGTWSDTLVRYTTITIQANGGVVGTDTFTWTYGAQSDTLTMQSYPQEIVNGVTVYFDEDTTYANLDQWTIKVCLPQSYTTNRLTDGTYYFKIGTKHYGGSRAFSSASSKVIRDDPDAPTLTSQSYNSSLKQLTLNMTAPIDSSVVGYLIRQNRTTEYGDEREVHWHPIERDTVSSGGAFSYIAQLRTGYNRIEVVIYDNFGLEGASLRIDYNIATDGSQFTDPDAPYAIEAEIDYSTGNIIGHVWVNQTCDYVNLYWDNQLGTIDYNTIIQMVPRVETGIYVQLDFEIFSGLSDGTYILGARAVSGTVEETNTDITCTVNRDTSTPIAPTNLSGRAVMGDA